MLCGWHRGRSPTVREGVYGGTFAPSLTVGLLPLIGCTNCGSGLPRARVGCLLFSRPAFRSNDLDSREPHFF